MCFVRFGMGRRSHATDATTTATKPTTARRWKGGRGENMKGKDMSKAQKEFALFLASENDAESAAAYRALCKTGATLKDVASHNTGDEWVTRHGNIKYNAKDAT
jgi:hypothetical protein